MKKKDLIKSELLRQTNLKLGEATKAYETSLQLTTSSEMKSEGKYDTRAIESGYLAGAQKARVEELKLDIKKIENIDTKYPCLKVQIGCLMLLKINETEQWYFLSPAPGGPRLNIENETIQVVSIHSPIGSEMIGLSSGESLELETPKGIREYYILTLM